MSSVAFVPVLPGAAVGIVSGLLGAPTFLVHGNRQQFCAGAAAVVLWLLLRLTSCANCRQLSPDQSGGLAVTATAAGWR